MDENKSLKNLLRPIVQYVNEEVEKSEERLKESFPTNTKGDVGPQGERGPKGDQGDPGGPPGPKGERGTVGPQGERGERGFLGEQGAQGEKGEVGSKGERGERGFIGEQGPQGKTGKTGERGFIGATGPQGERGERGEKGDIGNIGPKGLIGEQGVPGEQGNRGARGQRGQKGDLGEQGIAGLVGPKGDKGDKGDPGPKGDKGDPAAPANIKKVEKEFDEFKDDVIKQLQQARSRSGGGGVIAGTGETQLMYLDDVEGGTPSDGQILKYSGSKGRFVLSTDSATGFATESYVDNAVAAANTIQNAELTNLTAQTATFNSTSTKNLWGKAQGTTPFEITTTGSTLTIDLEQSNLFYITMGHNIEVTLDNVENVQGCAFTFIVTQDATGGRTWGWATSTRPKFPGGFATALSTAGSASDIISLVVANSTFVYSTTGINYL